MTRILPLVAALGLLGACASPNNDGVPRLRTMADVEAYNATVSSDSERLICTREKVVGTHFRELVCLTAAQRERLSDLAREQIVNLQPR